MNVARAGLRLRRGTTVMVDSAITDYPEFAPGG